MATRDFETEGNRGWARRLQAWCGVDRAIGFSLLNSARAMVGGPLVALLIALYFSPVVQGYYYTFASVLALQVFAELGFGTVLLQFASHEWAGLTQGPDGVAGRPENLSRLADLVRLAGRWYGIAAAVSTAGLMAGGFWFFRRQGATEVPWTGPWLCLCGLTGVKLFFTPFFSILEGCGQVQAVYGYRLAEGLLTTGVAALAVSGGAGLWTAAAVAGAMLAGSAVFLGGRHRLFFHSLWRARITSRVDWKREMLPMQWRIAVSAGCGYLVFQLATPMVFQYQGSQAAGQLGLTMTLVNAVSAIASAWIVTRAPRFGPLVASRRFRELDRLAIQTGVRAVAAAVVCAAGGIVGLALLSQHWPAISARFLSLGICALYLGAAIVAQPLNLMGFYLRAHKQEPLFVPSLIAGLLQAGATWYLARTSGMFQIAAGYLLINLVVVFPMVTAVFFHFRRAWQLQPAEIGLKAHD